MNVTFLIGNGFDLQMGLKSSFRDFEQYYISLPSRDSEIDFFKKHISENFELWSDFEKALGEFTSAFTDEGQDVFQRCLDDFSAELIQYLSEEEKNIIESYLNYGEEQKIRRSFQVFNDHMFSKVGRRRFSLIRPRIKYRFISFNYTHVFDWCIDQLTPCPLRRKSYAFGSRRYKTILRTQVKHVHGELPGPVIMGVNHPEQIWNQKWASDDKFQKKLIKPEISKRAGSTIGEEVTSIIHNSDVICIYGMSLGETDWKWWTEIGRWLLDGEKKLFIQVYADVNSAAELTHQKRFDLEDGIIDKFCDYSEYSPEERAIAEGKIHVLINPDMFRIKLKDKLQEENENNKVVNYEEVDLPL